MNNFNEFLKIKEKFSYPLKKMSKSDRTTEYTDCISAEG